MNGRYPDKPPQASDGKEFEKLCVDLFLSLRGEKIEIFTDTESQLYVGESKQGVEFKLLKNSHDVLHIEIAEKTAADRQWLPSGVMRTDNTVRYCCGNYQDVWTFHKADLVRWRLENTPPECVYGQDKTTGKFRVAEIGESDAVRATIRSFRLKKEDAFKIFLFRFCLSGGEWKQYTGPADVNHEVESLIKRFGKSRVIAAVEART
ncbi:MAG TPA: hypothetical protein VGQ63_13815 [Pseudolabrys sp.]|jgi:hypothetical protein|nr:hypothetical protein [Pseudolabrys sp.]